MEKENKYAAAQMELKRILKEQHTVSVPKLRRLINSLNVPLQPGKTLPTDETDYLKRQLKKRNDKLAVMGEQIKKLKEAAGP